MKNLNIDKYESIIECFMNDLNNDLNNDVDNDVDIIEGFAIKNPLTKIVKPLENIFKTISKSTKMLINAFKFDNTKLAAIILTIVVPFFGQFFARMFWLNGSLDKPWLLFFGIPPLTLLPAIMMMFGLVKKGKGGKPWDYSVLFPIFVNIILTFLLPTMFNIYTDVIIKCILISLSFTAIYWYKSKKICKNKSAQYSKLLYDSLISYILMIILTVALEYMPLFGVMFKIMDKLIPNSKLLFESITILIIYVITNMINGSYNKYCSDKKQNMTMIKAFIVSLIFALMTSRLQTTKIQ